MKITESTLSLILRRYLINNKISPIFINFEKSLIKETYDARGFNKDCQILVLEKPDSAAFEIESLEWPYSSEKVLLIYNVASKDIFIFSLEFPFKLIGRAVEDEFNFCNYHSLKICEKHILITAVGNDFNGSQCLNIVLLNFDGKIISIWKTGNVNKEKNNISNFRQLQFGHWIANLTFDKKVQNQPPVHRLYLLSSNQIYADSLLLREKYLPDTGTLLGSNTNEINGWFSEEIDNKSHFFVLASHYQCCVYRFDKQKNRYDKIADITLSRSFIDNIDDVTLTDDGITINFDNGKSLVKSGSFHFSFKG